MNSITKLSLAASCAVLLSACGEEEPKTEAVALTAQDAEAFIEKMDKEMSQLAEDSSRAAWLAANFINYDSQYVSTKASKEFGFKAVQYAMEAGKFDEVEVSPEIRRQLDLMKMSLSFPAPNDEAQAGRLAEIGASMKGMYGSGEYCNDEKCYSLEDMYGIFTESRDPELLKELWAGWRTVSVPMRDLYQEQVSIANQGAKDLGYENLSVLWRSKYDMEPDAFAADMDKQYETMKPLYEALHCHVRAKLNEEYGDEVVPATGKIPAHLLGNMWAQTWSNIYDLVKPEDTVAEYDLTQLITDAGMTEIDMVKAGEDFFSSLGFAPLPETFWERSLFVKPQDRDVVCHASAWNLDSQDDIRIKMCINKNGEDFNVVHHELGHNYYQRAYKEQPFMFQASANDGFHEAVGDTVALSITPKYLHEIGLMKATPSGEDNLGQLMQLALDKIAFLPFGLLVDKWRWQVFNGEISPEEYNAGWWELREKYQGIEAPVERSEADFDPGAKYHIPGNTPYTRYFLAFIQQFQFHKALCETAGHEGSLQQCSIYNNKEAGAKLKAMLEMGSSQPWPDAMEAITGQRDLDSSALVDYFEPLKVWLDEQNQGRQCGW